MLFSPNTGVLSAAPLEGNWDPLPSLLVSLEVLDSLSYSLMLNVPKFDLVLVDVSVRYRSDSVFRGLVIHNDTFTPAFGGLGVVASGFELMTEASCGCGGGVARSKQSWRT